MAGRRSVDDDAVRGTLHAGGDLLLDLLDLPEYEDVLDAGHGGGDQRTQGDFFQQ